MTNATEGRSQATTRAHTEAAEAHDAAAKLWAGTPRGDDSEWVSSKRAVAASAATRDSPEGSGTDDEELVATLNDQIDDTSDADGTAIALIHRWVAAAHRRLAKE